MMKKVLIGALVAVLVGGLAVAVWSTWGGSASAGDGERHGQSSQQRQSQEEAGGRYGQERLSAEGQASPTQERASSGRWQSGSGSASSDTQSTQGRGRGGAAGKGNGSDTAQVEPQAPVEELLSYEGTVLTADDSSIIMATADGQDISLEMGPSWFREGQDFALAVGDEVSVTGFYDGTAFEVASITKVADGQTLTLRGADGRPVWAGSRGQGGRS